MEYLESIEGLAEFYAGEIFDMAGGSNVHGLIIGNLHGEIRNELRKKQLPCRVYPPGVNLAIDADSSAVIPDVHVVCGEEIPSTQNANLNTNAVLVIEVASPSTSVYDRGDKFNRYKLVPNLLEYMLVEQSEPHVEMLRKQPSGIWAFESYNSLEETVQLLSLGIELPMAAIYDQVELLKQERFLRK